MTMATKVKRAAIYLRVSTDGQTTENQRLALIAVAEHRSWTVANVYEDAGISGAKGRDKRPGLDALLKDTARGRFDVVMAWAMDRLGRSLFDLLDMLRLLDGANVDLFLHQQAIDTTTVGGRMFFQVTGAFRQLRHLLSEVVLLHVQRHPNVPVGQPFGTPSERLLFEDIRIYTDPLMDVLDKPKKRALLDCFLILSDDIGCVQVAIRLL
jgi:hypothetical protein